MNTIEEGKIEKEAIAFAKWVGNKMLEYDGDKWYSNMDDAYYDSHKIWQDFKSEQKIYNTLNQQKPISNEQERPATGV